MGQKSLIRLVILVALAALFVLGFQASTAAPTWDEDAQLASGIAILRTGDPGFYRVNPPLSKVISAVLPDLIVAPELPGIYPASQMASGARHEFDLGHRFLEANHDRNRSLFILGRMPRVCLTVATAFMMIFLLPKRCLAIGVIAATLWLTSPLVLGHGWLVMPDAMSGTLMVLLILSTTRWWRRRDWYASASCGLVWGLCLSTKFTFCAVFLAWPIGTLTYAIFITKASWTHAVIKAIGAHVFQGLIAAVLVAICFGGQGLGMRFSKHHFESEMLSWLNESSLRDRPAISPSRLFGGLPSPLPSQFLIGIDEQQLDMEHNRPTFVDGTWYPEGVWWYYFYGIAAKEQLAVWLGVALMIVLLLASLRHRTSSIGTVGHRDPDIWALAICSGVAAGSVLLVLTRNSQMAVNVRYVFPALPAIYLLLGTAWCVCGSRYPQTMKWVSGTLGVVMLVEMICVFPNHFAYINPAIGGPYKTPIVLHHSNFDCGQDLWRLEKWLAANDDPSVKRYLCVYSRLPENCLTYSNNCPDDQTLEQMIEQRKRSSAVERASPIEVIVQRRQGWLKPPDATGPDDRQRLIAELLQYPPDEFITPTIAIYH